MLDAQAGYISSFYRETVHLALVLGTRPEIIKFSPLIRELEKRKLDHTVIHTGQHYSYKMDRIFFQELRLPQPDHDLEVGSGSHASQTSRILERIEPVLRSEGPDAVLVLGDTNTVLAGALASVKLHIPLVHVEAGLRSFDRRMPEEVNRVLTDHAADILLAPTDVSRANLLKEGISERKIFVTGNTIVDAVLQNMELARNATSSRKGFEIPTKRYALLTLHREENVDSPKVLRGILKGVGRVSRELDIEVIYPVHPRTAKMLRSSRIPLMKGITAIEPLGYFDFLKLESGSMLILTDSGGVQEEACTLKVPCVTLRTSTERPETLNVGANIVAGVEPAGIMEAAKKMASRPRRWKNPLGDGKAAGRIVEILTREIHGPDSSE